MYILVNIYICLKYIFNDAITGNYIYIMYVCLAYNIYQKIVYISVKLYK